MMISCILIELISFLLLLLLILVGVAYFTLFERKILGYIQNRKGPNKVGFMGFMQPFSDAIKLFSKEQIIPFMSNYYLFYFSPVFLFFLSLNLWYLIPYPWIMFNLYFGLMYFLIMLSISVYGLMISGWSSNGVYSLLGSLRSVAQVISYEVSLSFMMVSIFLMIESYSFLNFYIYQMYIYFLFLFLPFSLIWIVSMLAETNRTPFDFAEAESELVSGFNIEYSSGGFSLIFLSEYSSIMFMSLIYSLIFLGGNLISFFFFLKVVFFMFLFIWVRGSLPRYRYDKLMMLCWKSFLVISLFMIFFYLSLIVLLFSLKLVF